MFTILHDLTISVKPQQVYDAITMPAHLNNWWTLECAGAPKVGANYRLFFDPKYDWTAEVTIANAPLHFELKMVDSDEDWEPTSFGFKLLSMESSTRVEFYHSDWQVQSHHYRRTSYCWAILLHGLKRYAEEGHIIPFAERN